MLLAWSGARGPVECCRHMDVSRYVLGGEN